MHALLGGRSLEDVFGLAVLFVDGVVVFYGHGFEATIFCDSAPQNQIISNVEQAQKHLNQQYNPFHGTSV